MYTEGSHTTGRHRFHQHINTNAPCSCHHCVHYEQPAYVRHGGPGYQPASARQTDHPSLDCGRDTMAPRVKDVGGRAFPADRAERSGHRSPQRRPVFAGPGPRSQSDDLSQVCPWESNPAQWSCPPEPGVRHYPSVREQCGCVVRGVTRAHPFNAGIPHPLPHLQVRGQGYRHRRTVRYVSVEEEERDFGCNSESYHSEPQNPHLGHLHMPNGHCGPRPVFFEGGEERDSHQDRGRLKGGSEEGCNGGGGSHKGFFPTEVPQKHLNQRRQKGPCVPPFGITSLEPSKSTTNGDQRGQGSDVARQQRGQDSVRDQIRQVVTDLEDVLGGLKQVHVEMKEVVQQIDRLTARIDVSEETPCIAQGASNNFPVSTHPGDLRASPLPHHRHDPVQAMQHIDEDRILLRTNSPSPVHMASVVKTSRFTPPSITKDHNHERTGVNGHPPHLYTPRDTNHVGQAPPESHPQSLDPKVIIGNSTSSSRTQKPPLYPQNGRCGKGPYPPPKPVRTPAYPAKGCQSTSMV
ncbi:uncharacterized protein LOC129089123 [Anoplopoma fimbria]|uniref:uncharacterized protein LOC129089123 n=1 Tax=Anoplopoma fimbria TaxID=229290 RepID=UPI0023EDC86E|nr:uncharacterized protein LOC129089123 [Anoplopoma fimbria]XP_054452464.1 uncharacterized protein LOC129089123 [Anoplopoma fimbria]XP_054452465.1 uncharacterized protein LOC129089123 [Anoplopoma fimbria]XP_054452466.1 uncharacterized protein LOC129089123 [Anoplopoma fimbria]